MDRDLLYLYEQYVVGGFNTTLSFGNHETKSARHLRRGWTRQSVIYWCCREKAAKINHSRASSGFSNWMV